MTPKKIKLYMDIAERIAEESYANRLKVGAICVKDDCIIAIGYNGTPSGWDNTCETREEIAGEYERLQECAKNAKSLSEALQIEQTPTYRLITKPEVIHAEANMIAKLTKSTISSKDSVVFVTHSPCLECAKTLGNCGISTIYYKHKYRCTAGIDYLEKLGVKVVNV